MSTTPLAALWERMSTTPLPEWSGDNLKMIDYISKKVKKEGGSTSVTHFTSLSPVDKDEIEKLLKNIKCDKDKNTCYDIYQTNRALFTTLDDKYRPLFTTETFYSIVTDSLTKCDTFQKDCFRKVQDEIKIKVHTEMDNINNESVKELDGNLEKSKETFDKIIDNIAEAVEYLFFIEKTPASTVTIEEIEDGRRFKRRKSVSRKILSKKKSKRKSKSRSKSRRRLKKSVRRDRKK